MSVVNVSENDLLELEKKRKKKENNSNEISNASQNMDLPESKVKADLKTQLDKDLVKTTEISAQTSRAIGNVGSKAAGIKEVEKQPQLDFAAKGVARESGETLKLLATNGGETLKTSTSERNTQPSAPEQKVETPKLADAADETRAREVRFNSVGAATLDADEAASPPLNDNGNSPLESEREDEVSTKSAAYDKLKQEIDDIDEKYSFFPNKGDKISEDISLQRKEYVTKTDEDIQKEAENALSSYEKAQKDAINDKIDTKLSALNGAEDKLRAQSEIEKVELKNYYNAYKRQAENDALKRGLQRSSIVINNLNAFDKELIEKLISVDQKLGQDIADLNDEIASLNEDRQTALDEFNLTYAVKVNEKIKELKQEIQDKNDEILEYNNKITQIEAEYKADAKKKNQQIDEDYIDEVYKYFNSKDTIDSYKNGESIKAVEKYLNSLSKEDALSELTNNSFIKDILGTSLAYYIHITKAR